MDWHERLFKKKLTKSSVLGTIVLSLLKGERRLHMHGKAPTERDCRNRSWLIDVAV